MLNLSSEFITRDAVLKDHHIPICNEINGNSLPPPISMIDKTVQSSKFKRKSLLQQLCVCVPTQNF